MSDEQISALREGSNLKGGPQGTIVAPTEPSQMPHIPEELSILPMRGLVVFPGTVLALTVQRAASLAARRHVAADKVIGLLSQRDELKEDPAPNDLAQWAPWRSCSS
jgi:ATP-dependent Lon protease